MSASLSANSMTLAFQTPATSGGMPAAVASSVRWMMSEIETN